MGYILLLLFTSLATLVSFVEVLDSAGPKWNVFLAIRTCKFILFIWNKLHQQTLILLELLWALYDTIVEGTHAIQHPIATPRPIRVC